MQLFLNNNWKEILNDELEKSYFKNILSFIDEEKKNDKIIYPDEVNIFKAFNETPFDNVNVLLLGQDPYHGVGQANGLCFSVQNDIKIPPSLKNIFKELNTDIGKEIRTNGNLTHWAKQGVLMLNASLTVEENKPMSHSKIGWETFTDAVIKKISDEKEHVVFVLWGKFAQEKEKLIDASKHSILKAAHPSPLSAYNGFYGCKHFSKINEIVQSIGKESIEF